MSQLEIRKLGWNHKFNTLQKYDSSYSPYYLITFMKFRGTSAYILLPDCLNFNMIYFLEKEYLGHLYC
jgi:hypothetical protein